jgi:hypothetical protein
VKGTSCVLSYTAYERAGLAPISVLHMAFLTKILHKCINVGLVPDPGYPTCSDLTQASVISDISMCSTVTLLYGVL